MEPSLDLESGPFFVFDLHERGVESGAIRMLMAVPIADQDEMNFADHQRHFFRIFFIRFLQADPVISRIFQLFADFLRVTDDNVTSFHGRAFVQSETIITRNVFVDGFLFVPFLFQ